MVHGERGDAYALVLDVLSPSELDDPAIAGARHEIAEIFGDHRNRFPLFEPLVCGNVEMIVVSVRHEDDVEIRQAAFR